VIKLVAMVSTILTVGFYVSEPDLYEAIPSTPALANKGRTHGQQTTGRGYHLCPRQRPSIQSTPRCIGAPPALTLILVARGSVPSYHCFRYTGVGEGGFADGNDQHQG